MKLSRIRFAFPWRIALILALLPCLPLLGFWAWLRWEVPPLQRHYLVAYWHSSEHANQPDAKTQIRWLMETAPGRKRQWLFAPDALNIVEQINQTWTFCVALAAARQLLVLHPDVGGLRLAPGADACQALDIMSVNEGCVGAETFAAVTPQNNGKLAKDLLKLSARPEVHRYVFFMSPPLQGQQAPLSV